MSGLSFKGGYGRAFATAQRQLVQIDMPSTAALRGLLSALQTDVHQPCLPYNSQTNTGSTQHVSDIHVVDLSKLGVPALAWTETITAEGHSIPGGVAEMEANGTFVFLQFTGLRPLDDASIEALSQAALKRATA